MAAGQCTRQTRSFATHTTTHRPRALISSCTPVICIRACHALRVLTRWAHSTIAYTKGREVKVDSHHLRCITRNSQGQAFTRVEDQTTTHLLLCEDHLSQILVNQVMATRKCLANTLIDSANKTTRTTLEGKRQAKLTKIADHRQRLALSNPVSNELATMMAQVMKMMTTMMPHFSRELSLNHHLRRVNHRPNQPLKMTNRQGLAPLHRSLM